MPKEQRVPDALIIPETRKAGIRMVDRVASICDYAEPLLAVDRSKGERAHVRIQANGKLFVSKSIYDSINFPNDHPKASQPRYRWEPRADGTQFGYLRRFKKKLKSPVPSTEN